MQLGDRIAVMKAGWIVQLGTAEDLYYAPEDIYVARLFSDIDEIAGVVKKGEVETPFGAYAAPGFSEGEPVIVCVRQRAIEITTPDKGRPGRILNIKFLGDAARLEIAVDAHRQSPVHLLKIQVPHRRGSFPILTRLPGL